MKTGGIIFVFGISLIFTVTQVSSQLPTIENDIGTSSGSIGDDLQLKCIVRNRNENSTVEWFRLTNYLHISIGAEMVNELIGKKYDIRVTSANGLETTTLVIKHVDESDAGRYRCRVKVKAVVYTLWPKEDGFIEIQNQSSSVAPSISPVDKTEVEVNSGNDVTLSCDADGSPKPRITWYRDGVRTMMGTGPVLLLREMKPDHTGWYRCEAENGVKPAAVLRYHVSVRYKPTCNFRKDSAGHAIGTNATLQCYITGFPFAEVKWLRYTVDGPKILNPKFHRYLVMTAPPSDELNVITSTLKVYNITSKDYGTYICEGTNVVDTCEASARIYEPAPCQGPSCPSATEDDAASQSDTKRQQGNNVDDGNNAAVQSVTSSATFICLCVIVNAIIHFQLK